MGSIINSLAQVLGYIFEGIYRALDLIDIHSMGLCIILFTIVVRILMLPSTIKQQKFARLNSIMQPEIQAVQKKYKDKKDQASQMAQQEELRAVYDKYGTSPSGSCLTLVIQMAILFPLFQVIRKMDTYVPSIKALYKDKAANGDLINQLNKFFCYKLNESPAKYFNDHKAAQGLAIALIIALIIPVLSGLFQFLSVQLSTKLNKIDTGSNPMAGSMKAMNFLMPLFSVYLCWSYDVSIGLYWMTGSLIMMVTQVLVTKHLQKISVEDIIAENREKAEKKAEKRKAKKGIYRDKVLEASRTNTKNISSGSGMSAEEKEEKLRKAKEAMAKKEGSIASRANLVSEYNKKNEKK